MVNTADKCPACNSEQRSSLGIKNSCPIYQCLSCRSLYSERVALDYDDYYDESNLTVPDFIQGQLDKVFESLKKYRRTNRVLDIGCGAGSVLEAAKRAGWDGEGLEISVPAVEYVRSLGFKVFQGDLASAPYPDDYFDVVIASELLEHVTDPLSLLKQVARILRPGGVLWATTPNGRGVSSRMLGVSWTTVCPPEHLQLFSINGLRQLIEKAGFERIRMQARGCNPFEILHALRSRNRQTKSNGSQENAAGPAEAPAALNEESFDRVSSSYQLNEALLRNSLTRSVKSAANAALGLTGLGDSIRIQAEKREGISE